LQFMLTLINDFGVMENAGLGKDGPVSRAGKSNRTRRKSNSNHDIW